MPTAGNFSQADLLMFILAAATAVVVVLYYAWFHRAKVAAVLCAALRIIDRAAYSVGIDWRAIRARWRHFRPD